MPADIQIDDVAAAQLAELHAKLQATHPDPDKTPGWLVGDAIARVHRGFVGLPESDPNAPTCTGRFEKWVSENGAEVLIRQVDATEFVLAQPFRWASPDGLHDVPEGDITDLASVPPFLTWLVPRYGRHTLAALLHDSLQPGNHQPWPDRPDKITAEDADAIFRDAMGDTCVPLGRRWLMWSAVALRTQVRFHTMPCRVRAIVWAGLFAVAGLALWPALLWTLFGSGGLAGAAALLGVALAAPVVLCGLWWSLWRLGLISGLALLFIATPVLLVLAALAAFGGFEWLLEHTVPQPDRNPVRVANIK